MRPTASNPCGNSLEEGAGCPLFFDPSQFSWVGHEHDLAYDASFPQQLVRLSCVRKTKPLRASNDLALCGS